MVGQKLYELEGDLLQARVESRVESQDIDPLGWTDRRGRLEAPKHLARSLHDLYFEPKYDEFRARTIWSLSNAFTSAFKELDPIPQFKATAKLGEFLEARFSQSF
jgi:hypothetical protein